MRDAGPETAATIHAARVWQWKARKVIELETGLKIQDSGRMIHQCAWCHEAVTPKIERRCGRCGARLHPRCAAVHRARCGACEPI